jgi:phage terminase large subunit
MAAPLILDYKPRPQFQPFHARRERFACIVTHRRAGKTVACV